MSRENTPREMLVEFDPEPGFFRHIGATLVDLAAPKANDRVLDVGCGPGSSCLQQVADRVGAGGLAVGIDVNADIVHQAASDVSEVHVLIGDADSPPVRPASFDLILSNITLASIANAEEVVQSWRSLLRSGGRIAVSAFLAEVPPDWVWFEELCQRWTGRGASVGRFDDRGDLGKFLRKVGFRPTIEQVNELDIVFADPAQWWRWLMSTSLGGQLRQLPEPDRNHLGAQARRRHDQYRRTDGWHWRPRVELVSAVIAD